MSARKPLTERFWEKVQKPDGDGCWEWTGWKREGYGRLSKGGRYGVAVSAHRVSWEVHNGTITDGLLVCHTCDNRGCVRPDHLFLGTNAENMADMVKKGRSPRTSRPGEAAPYRKLSQAQVDAIRSAAKDGQKQSALAKAYAVSPVTICMILKGQRWGAT